ncbi:hypothetical protein Fmac_018173 [Flemingia macrophylla]|uniref:peptidylprolyl isomerase n=1 Tax=Flemingia macrophylla TaxID=520843 RepID=A0ABD1M479_9FABA
MNMMKSYLIWTSLLRRKKKKTKEPEVVASANQTTPTAEKQNLSSSEKKGNKHTETKPSQVRTFSNGLVINELHMGKPDGKKAALGKKLGVGQVIKGWEVGISGMRIGHKRRITILPSKGYGDKRVGSIPPNSWLVFNVELVDVDR